VNTLTVETVLAAPVASVFAAILDIEALGVEIPAFQRVEVRDRTDDGYVATMHERYGGRDVVITSQFRWAENEWVSYEHLDGPYGVNRGRFVVSAEGDATRLVHEHETEQDIAEGTALRADWIALMDDQHAAIERIAQTRA
jgi:ribosome-associated toxin RatA of RatAB toxin-antitoxin module